MTLTLPTEKHIQSVANRPAARDVTQPAGEAYSSRRTPLAAPFPKSGHEHVCCSPTDRSCVPTEMITLSAGESVTPFPHPHDETSPSAATGVDGSEPSASLSKPGKPSLAPDIPAETFREFISYDPLSGEMRWLKRPSRRSLVGGIVGSINQDGYRQLTFKGWVWTAHRVIWLMMTGAWPSALIDHRNLDRSDNRWCNLRPATESQNQANRPKRGKFAKGVKASGNRFKAVITHQSVARNLGTFSTEEEAARAYRVAARHFFGEFARFE